MTDLMKLTLEATVGRSLLCEDTRGWITTPSVLEEFRKMIYENRMPEETSAFSGFGFDDFIMASDEDAPPKTDGWDTYVESRSREIAEALNRTIVDERAEEDIREDIREETPELTDAMREMIVKLRNLSEERRKAKEAELRRLEEEELQGISLKQALEVVKRFRIAHMYSNGIKDAVSLAEIASSPEEYKELDTALRAVARML